MLVMGIVAEYDPFHNGHRYHLKESVKMTGATHCIAVLSGAFTQRSGSALIGKYARAKAAVRCGADLVIELPAPYSTASAEIFADKAVNLLFSTGVMDIISFGSECGDIDTLWGIAKSLDMETTQAAVIDELKTGISYAAARQRAAEKTAGACAKALSAPNNLLGVEYLRAISRHKLPISAVTVKRAGAGHHSRQTRGIYASAGHIRVLASKGGVGFLNLLPEESANILKKEMSNGRALSDVKPLERAMLARLRLLGRDEFAGLFDAAEGLENRFFEGVRKASDLRDLCGFVKSKRYAMSRIRRMALHAFLGIASEDVRSAPPYLRVLAFNERGRSLLAIMRKRAKLPILTRAAHLKGLSDTARRIFDIETAACDIRGLFCPAPQPFGLDYKSNPLYDRD